MVAILIARRALAAAIEAGLIAAISTLVAYIAAMTLWLFGFSERINAYGWLLAFGFLFSFLGSFSKGWLPPLGKKIARLHFEPPRLSWRLFGLSQAATVAA
jgi:hypothetical protein